MLGESEVHQTLAIAERIHYDAAAVDIAAPTRGPTVTVVEEPSRSAHIWSTTTSTSTTLYNDEDGTMDLDLDKDPLPADDIVKLEGTASPLLTRPDVLSIIRAMKKDLTAEFSAAAQRERTRSLTDSAIEITTIARNEGVAPVQSGWSSRLASYWSSATIN